MEDFQEQLDNMRHNYACQHSDNTVIVVGNFRKLYPKTATKITNWEAFKIFWNYLESAVTVPNLSLYPNDIALVLGKHWLFSGKLTGITWKIKSLKYKYLEIYMIIKRSNRNNGACDARSHLACQRRVFWVNVREEQSQNEYRKNCAAKCTKNWECNLENHCAERAN